MQLYPQHSSNNLQRCITHISDYLRSVAPSEAAIPPDPDIVLTEMPVAVAVEQEISFAPDDAEIQVATPLR